MSSHVWFSAVSGWLDVGANRLILDVKESLFSFGWGFATPYGFDLALIFSWWDYYCCALMAWGSLWSNSVENMLDCGKARVCQLQCQLATVRYSYHWLSWLGRKNPQWSLCIYIYMVSMLLYILHATVSRSMFLAVYAIIADCIWLI